MNNKLSYLLPVRSLLFIIILCLYYYKKKNPLPIMIGHALIEVASVVMILMTSISPNLYQTMLNM